MAYETGNTTGNSDLLSKLSTFAQANGWSYGACSGGGMVLSKNGVFTSITSDAGAVYMMGCTGYSSGSTWNNQPGNSGRTAVTNYMGGSHKAYHFFAGNTYIYVVVEVTTNIFRHFNFGELTKFGTYSGGAFVNGTRWSTQASRPIYTHTEYANDPWGFYQVVPFDGACYTNHSSNHVRADIDGNSNKFWTLYRAESGGEANSVVRSNTGLMDSLFDRSLNSFNQRTILLPIYVSVSRPAGLYSLIGMAPDIRYLNMSNYNPGQTLTIGSDEWVIFPLVQKTNTWLDEFSAVQSSAYFGLAYKKVT